MRNYNQDALDRALELVLAQIEADVERRDQERFEELYTVPDVPQQFNQWDDEFFMDTVSRNGSVSATVLS